MPVSHTVQFNAMFNASGITPKLENIEKILERIANRTVSGNRKIISSTHEVEGGIRRLDNSYRNLFATMATGGNFQGALANLLSGGGVQALADEITEAAGAFGPLAKAAAGTALAITGVVAVGTKFAITYQNLGKTLDTVNTSFVESRQKYQELVDLSNDRGLEFETLIRGQAKIQSAGVSAKETTRIIRGFSNELIKVGGTNEDLQLVVLALSQIASKVKLSTEEVNQLSERIPGIRRLFAQAFGTTDIEAVTKQLNSGADALTKLTDELEKMPQAQRTVTMEFAAMTNEFQQFLASFGQADIAGRLFSYLRTQIRSTKMEFINFRKEIALKELQGKEGTFSTIFGRGLDFVGDRVFKYGPYDKRSFKSIEELKGAENQQYLQSLGKQLSNLYKKTGEENDAVLGGFSNNLKKLGPETQQLVLDGLIEEVTINEKIIAQRKKLTGQTKAQIDALKEFEQKTNSLKNSIDLVSTKIGLKAPGETPVLPPIKKAEAKIDKSALSQIKAEAEERKKLLEDIEQEFRRISIGDDKVEKAFNKNLEQIVNLKEKLAKYTSKSDLEVKTKIEELILALREEQQKLGSEANLERRDKFLDGLKKIAEIEAAKTANKDSQNLKFLEIQGEFRDAQNEKNQSQSSSQVELENLRLSVGNTDEMALLELGYQKISALAEIEKTSAIAEIIKQRDIALAEFKKFVSREAKEGTPLDPLAILATQGKIEEIARIKKETAEIESATKIKNARLEMEQRIIDRQIENQKIVYEKFEQGFRGAIEALISRDPFKNLADSLRRTLIGALSTSLSTQLATIFTNASGGNVSQRGIGAGGIFGKIFGGTVPVFGPNGSPSGGIGSIFGGAVGNSGIFNFGGVAQTNRTQMLGKLAGLNNLPTAKTGSPLGALAGLGLILGGLPNFGSKNSGQSAVGGGLLASGALLSLAGVGAKLGIFGGPVGALIGAGIGAGVGAGVSLFRNLFDKSEAKIRDGIKNRYGVNPDQSLVKQVLGIAKDQYKGDVVAALGDKNVQDMVEYFKISTAPVLFKPQFDKIPGEFQSSGDNIFRLGVFQTGLFYTAPSAEDTRILIQKQVEAILNPTVVGNLNIKSVQSGYNRQSIVAAGIAPGEILS